MRSERWCKLSLFWKVIRFLLGALLAVILFIYSLIIIFASDSDLAFSATLFTLTLVGLAAFAYDRARWLSRKSALNCFIHKFNQYSAALKSVLVGSTEKHVVNKYNFACWLWMVGPDIVDALPFKRLGRSVAKGIDCLSAELFSRDTAELLSHIQDLAKHLSNGNFYELAKWNSCGPNTNAWIDSFKVKLKKVAPVLLLLLSGISVVNQLIHGQLTPEQLKPLFEKLLSMIEKFN